MSVSNPRPVGNKNPAVKFIKWKGGDEQGWFEYYCRETKKNIQIELTEFALLDKDLFSVTGFMNDTNSTIISNEVRSIDDIITVKAWKDKTSKVILKGSYREIKDTVKNSRDMKYTKSVYILFQGELCHLQMSGATFASWLQSVESNADHERCFISCTGAEEGKKGNVRYKFAVFEVGDPVDAKTWEQMIKVDTNILQPYLKDYLNGNGGSTVASGPTHDDEDEEQTYNTDKWREFLSLDGTPLGGLHRNAIIELNQHLIEDGQEQSELFANVGQAMFDYQTLSTTWGEKKNQAGKFIKDYTEAELKDALSKIPVTHKARQILEIAMDNMYPPSVASEFYDDDDDIPF